MNELFQRLPEHVRNSQRRGVTTGIVVYRGRPSKDFSSAIYSPPKLKLGLNPGAGIWLPLREMCSYIYIYGPVQRENHFEA